MKRTLTAAVLLSSLVVAGAAFAQGGPYIGGSIGQSNYKFDCSGVSCDKSDFGFKVFGGYTFTPYLGVEAHYVDLGKITLDPSFVPGVGTVSGDIKSSGFGLSLLAQYPIEQFSIFGKLGFTYLDTKVSGSISGVGSGSDSETATNFSYGIGGAYNFNKQLSARLEWERFRAEFQSEKEDVDLISIGITYRF